MASYRTPGVYYQAEAVPPGRAALPTGVPAFVGHSFEAGQPIKLTRLAQLAKAFVPSPAERYLTAAVQGFFLNGGTECLVVPLGDPEGTDPEAALKHGLQALEARQDLDLICAPDLHAVVKDDLVRVARMQSAILDHCNAQGDRFALLDAAPKSDPEKVLQQRAKLGLAGENGALYYPWVKPANAKLDLFVPPCGHIAGVVARCDRRTGVHKAPANEILEGVVDLETSLTDAGQILLHPKGINIVRAFSGRGIRIWGARTLSPTRDWTFISVRRLFLTAVRWIELNLADAAFEPNDLRLWNRITRELTAWLGDLFRAGALQGQTAAEAFFVKCDGETNPPEVRKLGQVVTVLGLAPVAPNEFVSVRIVQGAGGVDIAGSSPS